MPPKIKRRSSGITYGTVVKATQAFTAETSIEVPMNTYPQSRYLVPAGAEGIVYGRAPVQPGYWDVEFELNVPGHTYVRCEIPREYIEVIR